jgi:hypothetical protein
VARDSRRTTEYLGPVALRNRRGRGASRARCRAARFGNTCARWELRVIVGLGGNMSVAILVVLFLTVLGLLVLFLGPQWALIILLLSPWLVAGSIKFFDEVARDFREIRALKEESRILDIECRQFAIEHLEESKRLRMDERCPTCFQVVGWTARTRFRRRVHPLPHECHRAGSSPR